MADTHENAGFRDTGAWAGADLVQALRERFGEGLSAECAAFGECEITIRREILPALARCLRDEHGFEMLLDLCGVDHLGQREPRFEVVYHFYGLEANRRLRVCVPLAGENPELPSLTSLWKAADWYEREAWDLYGIRFAGHPDPRRLLLYDEFVGHPLRKDYKMKARQPLIGPGARQPEDTPHV